MKNIARGFTIVELLVVIVVIAILASVTVVTYNGIQDRAEYTKAQSDLKDIDDAIQIYKSQKGHYPSVSTPGVNPNQYGVIVDYQYDFYGNGPNSYFLKELIDGGYLDKMPLGTAKKGGKTYSYEYATNSDTSAYKLFRLVRYPSTLNSVELSKDSNSHLIYDASGNLETDNWGYYSADYARLWQ